VRGVEFGASEVWRQGQEERQEIVFTALVTGASL
jgi:hypothetical protein